MKQKMLSQLPTIVRAKVIVDKLLSEYSGADRATVQKDVADILNKLRSIGALEE